MAKKVLRIRSTNFTNKKNIFTYDDVIYSKDGWADIKKFVPMEYDLVCVKIEGKDRDYFGWWTGSSWEGSKISKNDVVIKWKIKNRTHDD